MKKKFLKVFSIVMCAFILAPNTPAVLAGDSDDEYSSNSSQSTNQSDDIDSKTDDQNSKNDGVDEITNGVSKVKVSPDSNQTEIASTTVQTPEEHAEDTIKKDYSKKSAIERIQCKRNNIVNGKYKYVSAFIANKFEKECKGSGGSFDFCTPFGEVKITATETAIKNGGKTFDCLVSCGNNVKGNYGRLSKYLDECTELELELIKIIYNYLSMYYDGTLLKNGEFDIGKFNEKVRKQFSNIADIELTNEQRASFAVFCGVLMGAEPWRFKDGGGLSRASIRGVYKLISDGVKNPFTIIFSDASEFLKSKSNIMQYFPNLCVGLNESIKIEELLKKLRVMDLKDGLAVFSHSQKNDRKSDYFENSFPYGGKWQQEDQIIGKRDKYKESQRSFNDNKFRMHFFDEYVSDDEDVA